ncbi:MAG: glycosyltransferase family 4 protein [Planctomycetota bacterium]|jgi:alpha-1,3-rhamnosyl/mannosyltransferase
MRILFDFEAVLKNRYSGFYSFGLGLLNGFAQLENRPEMVLLCSKKLASDAKQLVGNYADWASVRPVSIKMRWLENLWSFSSLPKLETLAGPFDIYHSFHHLMPPTRSAPRILTVHDLRRYVLPDLYQKSKLGRFETAVQRADHFIAVSESTKTDLCRIFDIGAEKVSVIHLAYDGQSTRLDDKQRISVQKSIPDQLNTNIERYLLAFSSPDSRKNISKIIRAFQIAKSSINNDIKLVVIGKPPKNESLPDCPDVIMAGPVDDIGQWLCGADGLVFASLYEGFGLPILEAFACGAAVITSDCSSMPEVASDAAILVDPNSTESIADGITTLCGNPEQRKQLIIRGYERLGHFSWTQTARKTLECYQKLL